MDKNNLLIRRVFGKLPHSLRGVAASLYSKRAAQRKYGQTYRFWSDFLLESQYWAEDKLRNWQLAETKKFLGASIAGSQYYHEVCAARQEPFGRTALEHISQYPIMDKSVVRRESERIRSSHQPGRQFKFVTSGTTGASLSVFLDESAYQREYAFRWKYLSVAGAKRGHPFAYFIGNRICEMERRTPPYYVVDSSENGLYFSIFHIAEWSIKDYVSSFNSYHPLYVKGYPSALYDFCKIAMDAGLEVRSPRAVFTASEKLHQYQRDLIESYFNAEVYEWYGQVETTVNVHECQNHRLHVKEEYGLLELLNDSAEPVGSGSEGHVIGTGWGNLAFPLIRYRTGDNMILSADQYCDCGMNGRIVDEIVGRDEDVVITPDGRRFGRLDFIFKPITSVKESQIVQTALDALTVRIVPVANFGPPDERLLRTILTDYFGSEMKISVQEIEAIPRTPNGKIRYVVSNINPKNNTQTETT